MQTELLSIIKEAGSMAKERFYQTSLITDKSPKDLVTDADREIEEFIIREIRKLYRDASFFGEESGLSESDGSRLFVIDPIDGTANFIFGVPYFAVSLAEIIDSKVTRSIVYNPMTEDLFYADSAIAAELNGKAIHCSRRKELNEAFVILGFSAHSENIRRYELEWDDVFMHSRKALPLLSPSLNLCSVAMGKADAFIDFGCSYEGQVAAAYILLQAGGSVRNYEDNTYDFRKTGIIATNGRLKL